MTELEKRDYYGDLQLPFGASEAVVRQRFKRLAKGIHPDVNRAPDAAEHFRRIRMAHDVLVDSRLRAIVDAWYSVSRKFARHRYHIDAPEVSQRPIVQRAQHFDDDRAFSFGCFGLIGFFLALISGLSQVAATPGGAFLVALVVGVVVGTIAAVGGSRFREWLLWLWCLLP